MFFSRPLGCTKMHESQNFKVAVSQSTLFYLTKSLQKELALKNGTFGKSARFRVPKNGTSSAQIFERTPKTSRNTPQNGGVGPWFMRFHSGESIKPIFKNCKF